MKKVEKKLDGDNLKDKINAILILKEFLPYITYFEKNTFIIEVMNKIIPMIQDKNTHIAKHAINFVGSVI